MTDVLLEVENLSVRDGNEILLNEVHLIVPSKEIVAILGETGSGKTMLAKSISGILPHNLNATGGIFYYGKGERVELNGLRPKERNDYRGKEILWIPQNSAASLNPLINMENQLLLPMVKRLGCTKREARKEIESIFEILDLSPREKILKAYPHELSGGMKVRAMIAIGLLMKSRLLILDEPTKGLDKDRCVRLMQLIQDTVKQFGFTVILISHDLEIVARHVSYAAVMYQGRVIDSGLTRKVLFDRPKEYVQALRKALPTNGMEVSDFVC